MAWDPGQYLVFADHRLRPALDLLARIPIRAPRRIFDLGCGPGNVTARLAERWPNAEIVGIDSSAEMLAQARAAYPAIAWRSADITEWTPPTPPDVLFSNAALQWIEEHDVLLPRLARALAPGGVLAVQMPHNPHAPTAVAAQAAARAQGCADLLPPMVTATPVAAPEVYYDLLAGAGLAVDLWTTEYLQVMTGEDPVLEWVRGTMIRPLIDRLDDEQYAAFLADYGARLRAAYPRRADGVTLFPFRRLFFVARRTDGG